MDRLPVDVLAVVLGRLPRTDVAGAMLTNRDWLAAYLRCARFWQRVRVLCCGDPRRLADICTTLRRVRVPAVGRLYVECDTAPALEEILRAAAHLKLLRLSAFVGHGGSAAAAVALPPCLCRLAMSGATPAALPPQLTHLDLLFPDSRPAVLFDTRALPPRLATLCLSGNLAGVAWRPLPNLQSLCLRTWLPCMYVRLDCTPALQHLEAYARQEVRLEGSHPPSLLGVTLAGRHLHGLPHDWARAWPVARAVCISGLATPPPSLPPSLTYLDISMATPHTQQAAVDWSAARSLRSLRVRGLRRCRALCLPAGTHTWLHGCSIRSIEFVTVV